MSRSRALDLDQSHAAEALAAKIAVQPNVQVQ